MDIFLMALTYLLIAVVLVNLFWLAVYLRRRIRKYFWEKQWMEIKTFNLEECFEKSDLSPLYRKAKKEGVNFIPYPKTGKKAGWLAFPFHPQKLIYVPVHPKTKEIVPQNSLDRRINLAHEVGHIMNKLPQLICETASSHLRERDVYVCLCSELSADVQGYEILRQLQLLEDSEISYFKEGVSRTLKKDCHRCLKTIKRKPENCFYKDLIFQELRRFGLELGFGKV